MSRYKIDYAGICFNGLRRKINQDNICFNGQYLPIIHSDILTPISGSFQNNKDEIQFAVFDGMGGEEKGELASFVAAKTYAKNKNDNPYGICSILNNAILQQGKIHGLTRTGTTIVSIEFKKNKISGLNVGDSRCYYYDGNELKQLSVDHTENGIFSGGALTRCLGDKNPKMSEPDVFEKEYSDGDIYLMCSDGLTKLVSDSKIEKILEENKSLEEKCTMLKEVVMLKGAVDNTTIVLFQINRKSIFGF